MAHQKNTGVSGGACVKAVSTVDDCKRECVRDESCVGIDWMSSDQVCLIYGRAAKKVTHYDYNCRQKDPQGPSKCRRVLVGGKLSPYSITERRVPELIPFLAVSMQLT